MHNTEDEHTVDNCANLPQDILQLPQTHLFDHTNLLIQGDSSTTKSVLGSEDIKTIMSNFLMRIQLIYNMLFLSKCF